MNVSCIFKGLHNLLLHVCVCCGGGGGGKGLGEILNFFVGEKTLF